MIQDREETEDREASIAAVRERLQYAIRALDHDDVEGAREWMKRADNYALHYLTR